MAETVTNAQINETYTRLKNRLFQRRCRITTEKPPTSISAVQGSIWGTTPKTAQKSLSYLLKQDSDGTRITSKAQLTSAYVNFTLTGCILSVALLIVCIWIALDLQNPVGFWSWLAQTNGQFDAFKAEVFIRLSWFLAAFLAVSLAVEAYILTRVRKGISVFAGEIVNSLQV